jgi:hypothetical protein
VLITLIRKYPVISSHAIALKNNVGRRVQIMELFRIQFLQPPICSRVQIIIPFLKTLDLCWFIKDRDQFSLPYKTNKIVVL